MKSPSGILHGKILIVDDEEANILLLERMLRGVGSDSNTSTTEAIRQRLREPFPLEKRGAINIKGKGKGEMHNWFLNGR